MATELAAAYVTIIPSLQGAAKTITNELSGVDTSSVGKSIGSNLSGSISTAAKAAVASIGTIGGAIGSLAATGGITRALNIEQAKTMFKGLNLEWSDYESTINAAVKGTAFGMDEAALVAARLAAAGVGAGDDMSRALNASTGMAATFGKELSDIGSVMGQVAAKGKLQGDEVLQLTERGIPVLDTLSKHLGVTSEEVSKMVSAGEIDFKTFSDAMYAAFGTAALNANTTFTGSLSNMHAALNRLGEKFATPLKDSLIPVFNAISEAIDAVSEALSPLVSQFSRFASFVSADLVYKIKTFTDALKNGSTPLQAFQAALGNVGGVIATVVAAIAGVGAVFGAVSSTVAAFAPGLAPVIGALTGGAGAAGVLSGALSVLKGAFSGVSSAVSAVSGFVESCGGIMGVASAAVGQVITLGESITAAGGGFLGFAKVAGGALSSLVSPVGLVIAAIVALGVAFAYLFTTNEEFRNTVISLGQSIIAGLAPAFIVITQAVQNLAVTVGPALINIFNMLVPVLGQIIIVIMQIVAALAPVISTIVATLVPILTVIIQLVAAVVETVLALVLPIISQVLNAIQTAMPVIQVIIMTVMGLILAYIEFAWPIIQTIIVTAMNVISAIIQTVWPFIQTCITTVMNVVQAVIQTVMAIIQGDWDGAWEGIKQIFSAIWDGICSIGSNMAALLGGIVSGLVNSVISFFSNLASSVASAVSGMWSNVRSAFSSGVSSAISIVSSLPGQIMGVFSGVGSWLVDSGASLIQGFVDGITGAIDWAASSVSGALERIRAMFPFSPAKKGPFSGRGWVLYSGISTAKAFGEGFEREADNARSRIERSLSDIRYGVKADVQAGDMSDAEAAVEERQRRSEDMELLENAIYDAVCKVLSNGVDVNVDKREFGRMVRAYG